MLWFLCRIPWKYGKRFDMSETYGRGLTQGFFFLLRKGDLNWLRGFKRNLKACSFRTNALLQLSMQHISTYENCCTLCVLWEHFWESLQNVSKMQKSRKGQVVKYCTVVYVCPRKVREHFKRGDHVKFIQKLLVTGACWKVCSGIECRCIDPWKRRFSDCIALQMWEWQRTCLACTAGQCVWRNRNASKHSEKGIQKKRNTSHPPPPFAYHDKTWTGCSFNNWVN